MSTSMHDRYYEPEDSMDASEWKEIQGDIASDLTNSWCNYKNTELFNEALSECGYEEDWTPDNIPAYALDKVNEYCWTVAMHHANEIMQDRGY